MSGSTGVCVGHVEATVHGRYLLREVAGAAPLLVAFHGYGEDAESVLRAALEVPGIDAWHVAAIQGLNRFYNRRTGEVVAGWMTKQDRELAIVDNVAYVEAAVSALVARLEVAGPRVYLGFSQGTAMSYRAAVAAGNAVDGIIALAGDAPPELAATRSWTGPTVLIGCGTKDDLYGRARARSDADLLSKLGSNVEIEVFEGGHEWVPSFRRTAGDFLRRLR